MPKRTIDHHASIVIVKAENLFFFNGYDSGYPRAEWRGCLNPLGGNHELGDISPLSILEREVNEEMTNPNNKYPNFAEHEAEALRHAIRQSTLPYQDFLVVDPIIEKNKHLSKEGRSAIVSFYEANVPIQFIDEAYKALKSGKRLVSEGDGGNIVSIDDLTSGRRYLAWSNPLMMAHFLKKEIPAIPITTKFTMLKIVFIDWTACSGV